MTGKIFMNFEVTDRSHGLAAYRARGGYETLEKALREMTPEKVQQEVAESNLRGRGGAGFPTGTKWSFINRQSPLVYLTCNADEGEPGTFKDRWLMENLPHLLLEGILLSAYALKVRHAFIYIRGEFDLPYRRICGALEEAREAGYVGEGICGSSFSCEVLIHRGAGAYVCGEETGLLTSIEGFKGYPKNKPPFPAIKGLFGAPTVINNVETLATIPWIVKHGGGEYKKTGTPQSTGTRLFGVSGHVNNPGIFEKPLGYPLEKLIEEDAGGVLGGLPLKAVIPGGCSTPILKAEEIRGLTLDFESLGKAGSMLGSGGVIVIAEGVCMVRLLYVLARFYSHESCGQCTPCREGTAWMADTIRRLVSGGGIAGDIERLEQVAKMISGNTVCALGDAATMPVLSFLKKFRDEFEYAVKAGRLLHAGRLETRGESHG
jgi:NADH-quinone oxidoreductase subunit F